MNSDIIKGKTKEVKGQLKSWWGKLTDNDIKRIEGDAEQLAGTLQERYGWTKDQTKKEIEKRFAKFNSKKYSTSTNYREDRRQKAADRSLTSQNMEDKNQEAEYEAAEGDLTERPRKFYRQITTENPIGWVERDAISRTEDV